MIVDSHCHVSPGWYEPVESLVYQMTRYGVQHAVLVQMQGQADNEYQFEVVRRFPGQFASVVWLDTSRPGACDELHHLAARGISGVRLSATDLVNGPRPLAVWQTAAELGLAVSCSGAHRDFTDTRFARVVQMLPRLRIVIEHLGGPVDPVGDEAEQRRQVFALARFRNVYVKIHGLGEFCRRAMPVREPFPFELPIPRWVDIAYDHFGPDRMMWGSDYPPVSGREGYGNALHLTLDQFASRRERDKALIFGGVAREVFPLCR